MYPELKKNKSLIYGPIGSGLIASIISEYQSNTELGSHCLFLGQVRADQKDKSKISAISLKVTNIIYTGYEIMADKEIENIKQKALRLFSLHSIHIVHSLGEVRTGEISMLAMVSSEHRENCFEALKFIVNKIKTKVPIWKKEIYEDGSFRWVR
jgi:molybdopterin synthase catalytic subunit